MNTITKSAVRNFMDSHPIKPRKSVLDSMEYKRALEAMDAIIHKLEWKPFRQTKSFGISRSSEDFGYR